MSDDSDLEREIRGERKFSLEEAIARMAGPGAMKGASPVTRQQQAAATIDQFVRRHVLDATGALVQVLVRDVAGGEQLLRQLGEPLRVLADHLEQLLASDYALSEFVREVDAQWGRMVGERPYFELSDRPPHEDDPYTRAAVKEKLMKLRDKLAKIAPG